MEFKFLSEKALWLFGQLGASLNLQQANIWTWEVLTKYLHHVFSFLHSLPFPLKGPLLIFHQHSQGNAIPSVSWELAAVPCTWHFAKGHLPSAPKCWRVWDPWQSPSSTLQARQL